MVSHWERGTRNPNEESRKKLEEALDPLVGRSPDDADNSEFNPESLKDARERTWKFIAQRRGQKKFREDLLEAYEGMCAVTGCAVKDVLEAAHIYPYRGNHTNDPSNGLLLRADIHTLFDIGLVTIHPDSFKVLVKQELRKSSYGKYHNKILREPKNGAKKPDKSALETRFSEFDF